MKRRTIIIICILLVIVAVGIYAYSEFNRKHPEMTDASSAFSIKAVELVSEFENDDSAASKKYLGKVITVDGTLKEINDAGNSITIVLGDTASMSSVRCAMDTGFSLNTESMLKGSFLTVKGNCTGFNRDELLGSDVVLNRCIVLGGQ
jgi:hypothetical protein